MKYRCPQTSYRLTAAAVVLATFIGAVVVAFNHPGRTSRYESVPVFSLASMENASLQQTVRERAMFSVNVTVTGYSSTPGQTDSTPFITASNTRVRQGIIAMSRDLLRAFTPGAPFAYGDLVEIEGIGVFRVEDTMNSRYSKRVDIWFPNQQQARNWGVQHRTLSKILEPHVPAGGASASAVADKAAE